MSQKRIIRVMSVLTCLTFFLLYCRPSNGENIKDEFTGLHLIHDPPDSTIDIVAVHGLDGHWKRSWLAENGVFWLSDLLPQMMPQARIFSFGHDSRTRGSETPLTLDIADHGQDLVAELVMARQRTNTETTPIIFIGHSLGGLVIKSALLHSNMARVGYLESQKSIKLSTSAIMFLGTPHQGGEGVSLLQVMTTVLQITTYTNKKILKHLEPTSDWLLDLQSRYNYLSADFETTFFYETYATKVPLVGKIKIVPRASAVVFGAINAEAVPLAADHGSMVKYLSSEDPNFQKVAKRLQILAARASSRVQLNWHQWSANKEIQLGQQISDRSLFRNTNYPQEFFIGMAFNILRNQQFVGRQTTLTHLDNLLRPLRSREGVYLVVLYGVGGIGKTQLALEYAYTYNAKYSSIFWIDGSREDTAAASVKDCLASIKTHYEFYGLNESPRYRLISDALNNSSVDKDRVKETQQARLTAFLKWLSYDDNRSWMVIIDNVDDLESYNYRTLIPSASGGAVLITSRRSDLAIIRDAIEVREMDLGESLDLLQRSSGVIIEAETEESASAIRLVDMLGYLPLAISQAGAHIATYGHERPITSYVSLYTKYPRDLLRSTATSEAWDYRKDSVLTTWEVSFNAVQEKMPEATRILLICGYLSPGRISRELFIEGNMAANADLEVQQAFSLLVSYSFIRDSGCYGEFSMHPLVHAWTRIRMTTEDQMALVRETLLMVYRFHESRRVQQRPSMLTDHVWQLLSIYKRLLPCDTSLEHVVDLSKYSLSPSSREMSTYVNALSGWTFWIKGHLDSAITYGYQRYFTKGDSALEDWEIFHQMKDEASYIFQPELFAWVLCQALKSYPIKHPRILNILGNYAWSLYNINNIEGGSGSIAWYQWLLSARIEVLGLFHPATSGAMLGLSQSLAKEAGAEGCEKAVEYSIAAYEARTQTLGFDDHLTKTALRGVLEVTWLCGRYHVSPAYKNMHKWLANLFPSKQGQEVLRPMLLAYTPDQRYFPFHWNLAQSLFFNGKTPEAVWYLQFVFENIKDTEVRIHILDGFAIRMREIVSHPEARSHILDHLVPELVLAFEENQLGSGDKYREDGSQALCTMAHLALILTIVHLWTENTTFANFWIHQVIPTPPDGLDARWHEACRSSYVSRELTAPAWETVTRLGGRYLRYAHWYIDGLKWPPEHLDPLMGIHLLREDLDRLFSPHRENSIKYILNFEEGREEEDASTHLKSIGGWLFHWGELTDECPGLILKDMVFNNVLGDPHNSTWNPGAETVEVYFQNNAC